MNKQITLTVCILFTWHFKKAANWKKAVRKPRYPPAWKHWKSVLTTYEANIRTLLCLPHGHWGSLSRFGSYSTSSRSKYKPITMRMSVITSEIAWRENESRTWFLCHAVVQTSRREASLPVATETRLSGRSCAGFWYPAALRPHQSVGWIKELSVWHSLGRRNRHFKSWFMWVTSAFLIRITTVNIRCALTLPMAPSSTPSREGSRSAVTTEESLCLCASSLGSLFRKRNIYVMFSSHTPHTAEDDVDHTGGWWKQKKSNGWVFSAWDGAFFIPDVCTLSIGQHWESSI